MASAQEFCHASGDPRSVYKVFIWGPHGNKEFLVYLGALTTPLATGWELSLTTPGEDVPRSYSVRQVKIEATLTDDPDAAEESETEVEIIVEQA